MRAVLLSPTLHVLLLLPTLHALTLTDFQPINGFSAQCTQSYNTPLQGCTHSDFQNGHPCSTDCITFLEALTKMLNTDCKGTSAYPNTLIGLFFSQQGTSTLCPNVLGSSGSEGDQASYSSPASPGGTSTSPASEQQASTTAVSTASSSASLSPTTSQSSSSPSDAAATSSTVVVVKTTITPSNSPSNMIPITATPSSIPSSVSPASSAPQASRTSNASGQGGGTILDLGSTAAAPPALQLNTHVWALLGGIAFLAWLF